MGAPIKLTPTQAFAVAKIVRDHGQAGKGVEIEPGFNAVNVVGSKKVFAVGKRGKVTEL